MLLFRWDDIIKIEDFDPDNIQINKKSDENILVYNISYENLTDSKPLRDRFNKLDGLLEFMIELGIYFYLEVKNI